ncbi:MAG: hypothetical protein WA941_18460 [Nitrososphaeraceae archaeon]
MPRIEPKKALEEVQRYLEEVNKLKKIGHADGESQIEDLNYKIKAFINNAFDNPEVKTKEYDNYVNAIFVVAGKQKSYNEKENDYQQDLREMETMLRSYHEELVMIVPNDFDMRPSANETRVEGQMNKIEFTPFQVYVLAYFTSEELDQQRKGEVLGRKLNGIGYTANYRFATNINELTTIINQDLIPGATNNPDDIIKEIEDEIGELLEKGLLQYEKDTSFRGKQLHGLYITPKGKAYIRRCFRGLAKIVADKTQYEGAIEQVDTSSTAKQYLKGLREKLVDKSQDEILEAITSGVKMYAPAGIAAVLRLVGYAW